MSKLVQYTDLNWYPSEGIRREYRRSVYSDGVVVYDIITETDKSYGSVELTEGQYYNRLWHAMECQRKRSANKIEEHQ